MSTKITALIKLQYMYSIDLNSEFRKTITNFEWYWQYVLIFPLAHGGPFGHTRLTSAGGDAHVRMYPNALQIETILRKKYVFLEKKVGFLGQ